MKKETVLITGSSRGLGEELALVFAGNKHDMILHGRNKEDLARVKEKVIKTGVNCETIAGDLRLDETIEELNRISTRENVSVLINNAGISLISPGSEEEMTLPLNEISDEQIDDILIINLIAPVKLTKRLYTLFQDIGHGTVININSLAGLELQELKSIYGTSKWGLRGFTDTFRLEADKLGVRVIGVYPSRIKTKPNFTYGMEPREVAEKIYAAYADSSDNEVIIDGRPGK
ncbi:SDR family NAD(P)-dependent oxidoreductase [Chloroflexota bacterium]